MSYFQSLKESLEPREAQLYSRLDPEVEKIVARKNISLFKAMLDYIQYPDMEVVSMISLGLKITGELEPSGLYRPHLRGGEVDPWQLCRNAKQSRADIQSNVTDGWTEEDQKLLDCTMEEVGTSLIGPLTAEQVSAAVAIFGWHRGVLL